MTDNTEDVYEADIIETPKKGLNAWEWKVAELQSLGKTKKEIATELGLSISEVYNIANKKAVKLQTEEMTSTIATDMLNKNLRLLDGILEAKLEKLEEDGKTLADSTNKDIVDLIKDMSKIKSDASTTEARDRLGSSADGYTQILNQILVVNAPNKNKEIK